MKTHKNSFLNIKPTLPLALTLTLALALTLALTLPTPLHAQSSEPHLANLRQLTMEGENAEAYFSADGKQLILQSTHGSYPCDQIFTMKTDGSGLRLVSTGKGRTTCAYFYPDGSRVLFSSTHAASDQCPAPADYSKGYVWPLYSSYDIYSTKPDGSDLRSLTATSGYDAEATISPDGKKIIFTSDRDGDLELYTMDLDGKNVRRLTHFPGYDGGAFFSPDSTKIVFRGHHITDEKELAEFRDLLKQNLVRPFNLEIFLMDADGQNVKQITNNGAANFCPFFHPDGKRIIFASSLNDPKQRNFDLFMVGIDGKGLEQITFDPTFDGFPMFSPDGKQLVFSSNRNSKKPGDTNLFIADWIENPANSGQTTEPPLGTENLKKHIEFLASDEMKGRLTGTPEARKAAEYIAAEFQKHGLTAPPPTSTPYQQFEFTARVKISSPNSLTLQSQTSEESYAVGKDFIPTGFSDDATLRDLPVLFAGYGIKAPDLKFDDYAGLEAKEKAVVVYRFGPEGDDPKSEFAQYYSLRYKAMTAREQGAAAILVVSDNEKDDELYELKADASFGTSGIPVISIKRSVIAKWLKEAGKDFGDPKDPHTKPLDFELSGVTLSLECRLVREKAKSDNVLGWLPAAIPTDETIVIGAHYDHLGMGIEGSLAEKRNVIHNGADDNASGVAGLLELARVFSQQKEKLNRNILFIAFGGEELGVLGSSYFTKNPIIPLKKVVAMLNMDMIGRLRDKKLVIGGTGTSPSWNELLNSSNKDGLSLKLNEDGYGPSDHSMFYAKDIPVLFFFTGQHAEYHKPEDDPPTIEYAGLAQVVRYVYNVTEGIENLTEAPKFTRVKGSSQEMASRGFRVYLGTIPDYTEEVKGVKLSGVREDSPAEKAGMMAGDVIVEFAGKKIENVYDYTFALQDQKPGDVVTVIVLRDGARVSLQVTLGKRAASQ